MKKCNKSEKPWNTGITKNNNDGLDKLLQVHPEVNPWKADASGWTPIHYAAAYGKSDELYNLLAHAKKHYHDPGNASGSKAGGGGGYL